MKKNTKNDLVYYTFESFDRTNLVAHAFSTRLGGVSEGCWSSMNLGFSRGDDRDRVLKNYDIICSALGIDPQNIVCSHQTHTTNVLAVTEADRGNGYSRENNLKDIDGLATNCLNTALVTFYADCVPLFFLDPVKRAISTTHAGWRGTLYKISENTVKLFTEQYGSDPADILVGIGPSIGGCCFEVDEPVYSLFEKEDYAKDFIEKISDSKRNINLWEVNREILVRAGVRPENIEIAGICTKCNPDEFYSHRVMGNDRGSLAAIMELK